MEKINLSLRIDYRYFIITSRLFSRADLLGSLSCVFPIDETPENGVMQKKSFSLSNVVQMVLKTQQMWCELFKYPHPNRTL